MTTQDRFRTMASQLGLTGGWLEVGHKALLDRTIRMPSGCYFLVWDRFAILWLESESNIDHRIPTEVAWLWAWGDVPNYADEVRSAFRNCQGFPHREALLRQVGFHQWNGPFGVLECVATPVEWEWR